jgi:D-alanine--poly(phosphoribitol) ligase subunit 1
MSGHDDPGRAGERSLSELTIAPGALERIRASALHGPHADVDVERLLDRVRRIAGEDPDRPAVRDGKRTVTYAQLVDWADHLISQLGALQVPRSSVVAYFGPRSVEQIVALLAVDAISAVYLPIETSWPDSRARSVLDLARAHTVLRHPDAMQPPADAVPIGRRDDPIPDPPGQALRHPSSTDASYIIFTSGTTGAPKGATVERRGMLNHLWSKIVELRIRRGDVVAYTAPIGFDISIWQMLAPLLAGASVEIVADRDLAFPRRIIARLTEGEVTVAELVPSVIRWLVAGRDTRAAGPLPLRCLLSTGEELSPSLAAAVLERFERTLLVNAFGPTECSDDVTHARITPADLARARLPIGVPVQNTALHVLRSTDAGWEAVDDGEQGELFVGGLGVGRGYVGNPAATLSAFFRDTLDPRSPTGRLYRTGDHVVRQDGRLEYRGRRDRQVKLAGVRMELDEIQLAIEAHPLVAEAAVAVAEEGARAVVTAHVVFTGRTWDFGPLKEHLASTLPPAMVPTRWTAWEQLPHTPNGKVDHHELVR